MLCHVTRNSPTFITASCASSRPTWPQRGSLDADSLVLQLKDISHSYCLRLNGRGGLVREFARDMLNANRQMKRASRLASMRYNLQNHVIFDGHLL